jgi:alpha-glucoside transport system permease protein
MAARSASKSAQLRTSNIIVNGVLILICLLWTIPTIGVLVTSFRDSRDIFTTGWWTVLPHMAFEETGEIKLDSSVDVDGPITIDGVTHTFAEWRQGVTMPDGRKITWYGNKRTRLLKVQQERWEWFGANLTLDNYKNVLTGQDISYKDAEGNTIVRKGSNFSVAFLNSIAVTVPSTIIPILIAAFAAYGFAWINFPGRKFFFTIVVALLVVPLQLALVPILQDYTVLGLNGTYMAMWLAHTGFGLPLAIYLLFNYISTIPRDILESAFIDGASNFTIFTQLIFPLSVPALASFAIFRSCGYGTTTWWRWSFWVTKTAWSLWRWRPWWVRKAPTGICSPPARSSA